jgi:hypothetical protein
MIRVKPLAIVGVLSLLTLLTACTEQSGSSEDSGREALLPAIDSERLSSIVKTLASDEFEGRAPGGIGEEKTVAYLIERFTALGLEPGGEEGAWTQPVPLVHTQLAEDAVAAFSLGEAEQDLVQGRDVEFSTTRPGAQLAIDSAEVVFVGFGASAPERNWDDFGDVDLKPRASRAMSF